MTTRLLQILLVVAVVAAWEGAARLHWIDPFYFSAPSRVAMVLWKWFASGMVWRHLWLTTAEAAVGFVIGLVAGLTCGFVLAALPRLDAVCQPFLVIANALPRISYAPWLILLCGLGFISKVIIVVSIVFFVVFFNTYRGFKEVPPIMIKNARVLGATRIQLFWYIYLPASLAWTFASLRVSVGFAITGAVLGEYIGASGGIGYLIDNALANFDAAGVVAGLVVLTGLVMVVDAAVTRIETRICKWKHAAPLPGEME